ncbi:MAG TPA: MliC family protein [Hanamia sp.]|nr:MliC family protein [Hanamia sp.]
MTKNILTIAILAALFLNACKGAPDKENAETTTIDSSVRVGDDIVKTSSTDNDGKKLVLTFNNTKGTTTLDFNGETIELIAQKAASGIWYKNDHYELRGKGNDIELTKDGKVVFTHTDDVVRKSLKNNEGQTLDMTFNNTTNEAKIYLNGGEQIELVGQKPASGIWYKNEQYELRRKGDKVELTKDGKTVFKN